MRDCYANTIACDYDGLVVRVVTYHEALGETGVRRNEQDACLH